MNIVRLGIILMLIAGVAAGGLSLLNNQTAPIIKAYKEQQQAEARMDVSRSIGATHFDKVTSPDGFEYYKALDDSNEVVGYVALARGKGYSSTIETIAGFDTSFTVSGIKITFQQETPGLGTKSTEVKKGDNEPWFQRQFRDKDGLTLAVKKDRGDIDAITGATITSRGVTNSVREVALKIKNAVEQNGNGEQEAEVAAMDDAAVDSTAAVATAGGEE